MKVLVTAASKYGATGEIAQAIGNVLAEYGFDTKVMPPEAVGTFEPYDAIVSCTDDTRAASGSIVKPHRTSRPSTGSECLRRKRSA
jgi:hypothetical protein